MKFFIIITVLFFISACANLNLLKNSNHQSNISFGDKVIELICEINESQSLKSSVFFIDHDLVVISFHEYEKNISKANCISLKLSDNNIGYIIHKIELVSKSISADIAILQFIGVHSKKYFDLKVPAIQDMLHAKIILDDNQIEPIFITNKELPKSGKFDTDFNFKANQLGAPIVNSSGKVIGIVTMNSFFEQPKFLSSMYILSNLLKANHIISEKHLNLINNKSNSSSVCSFLSSFEYSSKNVFRYNEEEIDFHNKSENGICKDILPNCNSIHENRKSGSLILSRYKKWDNYYDQSNSNFHSIYRTDKKYESITSSTVSINPYIKVKTDEVSYLHSNGDEVSSIIEYRQSFNIREICGVDTIYFSFDKVRVNYDRKNAYKIFQKNLREF